MVKLKVRQIGVLTRVAEIITWSIGYGTALEMCAEFDYRITRTCYVAHNPLVF